MEKIIIDLDKMKIEDDLNNIIRVHFSILLQNEGNKCKKCGIVQGNPAKGFYKYYCRHLTRKIDKELRIYKQEVCINMIKNASGVLP